MDLPRLVRVHRAAAFVALVGCGSRTGVDLAFSGGNDVASSASSGGASGATTGGGSTGTTGGSSGDTSSSGSATQDCTTTACTPPQVCCPQSNTCTAASPSECWGPIWVACTRASDCPSGEVCCVEPAELEGGSMGSVCRSACVLAVSNPSLEQADLGYACSTADPGGGVGDCPSGLGTWLQCEPLAQTPASLGVCVGE